MSKLGQPSPKKAIQPNALQCKAACSRANSAQKWQRYITKLILSYISMYIYIYFNKHTNQINTQTHAPTSWLQKSIEILSKTNRKPFWSRACPIVFSQESNFNRRLILFKNQSIYWFFSIVEPLGLQVLPRKIINREQHLRPKNGEHAHKKKATKAAFRNSTKNVGT